MNRSLPVFLLSLLLTGCSNYTTEPTTVNTPIILGIANNGTGGHTLTIAAFNAEVGFIGYRLFIGTGDAQIRNAPDSSGIDCQQPLAVIPNQGVPYAIDVQAGKSAPAPNARATSSNIALVCNIPVTLTSGSFVALRAVKMKNILETTTGESSNSILVP